MNRAIIDIETGGFSITKNGVCEIGVLIINEYYEELTHHYWLIKPYTRPDSDELVSYKEDAMAVNGISMEEIENGFDVATACFNLFSNLQKFQVKTLIGHNIRLFDFPRIQYISQRFINYDLSVDYDILDTLEESKKQCLNLESYSLESLCKHFTITNNDSHRSLGDCYATLELLKKLNK